MKKVSNNYHYYNNHEYKIFITILSVILLLGCSPAYRYNRLLEKYPYLQDTIQQTEIVIRDSVHQDTQIVWNTKIDTIVLNQVRIERRNDTFRILTRERPCTTYVNKTIVKPSETIKQYIEKKASEKGFFGAFHKIKEWIWLIIIGLLVILLIRK